MSSTTRTNGKVRASADKSKGFARLVQGWQGIRARVPEFGPIRNERTYVRMNVLMDSILKEVGDDEDHELADLLDIVSTLVAQYENANQLELSPVEPREVLRFLMEQHGLRQSHLAKELGTQSVVSEVLAGQRELNTRQIRALSRRFKVSPAVFIAP